MEHSFTRRLKAFMCNSYTANKIQFTDFCHTHVSVALTYLDTWRFEPEKVIPGASVWYNVLLFPITIWVARELYYWGGGGGEVCRVDYTDVGFKT